MRWTADKVLTLALMVVCGGLLFFGVYLLCAACSFFTTEGLLFLPPCYVFWRFGLRRYKSTGS